LPIAHTAGDVEHCLPEPVRLALTDYGFCTKLRRVGFNLSRVIARLEYDRYGGSRLPKQLKVPPGTGLHDSVVKNKQMEACRPQRFEAVLDAPRLDQQKWLPIAMLQHRTQSPALSLLGFNEQDSEYRSGGPEIGHLADAPFLAREHEQVVQVFDASSARFSQHEAHLLNAVDRHAPHTAGGGRR
jgi:hypothetical protein